MTENSATAPLLRRVNANGVALAYFEWRADLRGTAPTLLLVHATGFHGRVWDQVIARLPARHVIALEQRGHGRSETTTINNWALFGHDLAAFVAATHLQQVIGVGHSMGAHALVRAAAVDPSAFDRLVLIDPVILAPEIYLQPAPPGADRHPAERRVNRFESVAAMIERFAQRAPYALFDPLVLRDYCEHGLVAANTGSGLMLACDPVTEGSVYLSARDNADIYDSVRALTMPVLVVRAKLPAAQRTTPDFGSSPSWPGLAAQFANGREVHLADESHLVPMQNPQRIAQLIRQELDLSDSSTAGAR